MYFPGFKLEPTFEAIWILAVLALVLVFRKEIADFFWTEQEVHEDYTDLKTEGKKSRKCGDCGSTEFRYVLGNSVWQDGSSGYAMGHITRPNGIRTAKRICCGCGKEVDAWAR